jgi:hypothetical protein
MEELYNRIGDLQAESLAGSGMGGDAAGVGESVGC